MKPLEVAYCCQVLLLFLETGSPYSLAVYSEGGTIQSTGITALHKARGKVVATSCTLFEIYIAVTVLCSAPGSPIAIRIIHTSTLTLKSFDINHDSHAISPSSSKTRKPPERPSYQADIGRNLPAARSLSGQGKQQDISGCESQRALCWCVIESSCKGLARNKQD